MAWRKGLMALGLAAAMALPAFAQPGRSLAPLKEANRPTRLAGAALNVADIEKMREFYVNVLGMKVVERVPAQGPLREYLLSFGDSAKGGPVLALTKAGRRDKAEARTAEDFGRLIFAVPNGEALARRAAEAGYPPSRIRPGSNTITDPEGHQIELFQEEPTPAGK